MATKKAGKKKSMSAREPTSLFMKAVATAPTESDVTNELTIFWDAFSPLNLAGVRQACENGNSLADIGVGEDSAATFINKYNSIILRAPGVGPFVASAESKRWDSEKMSVIVHAVTTRAQP